MTWLDDHRGVLGLRQRAFEIIDQELRRYKAPHIVETGGLREPGNTFGDGNSTLFFDSIARDTAGRFISIDLDPKCAENVHQHCSGRTTAVTGNSLVELPRLGHLTVNCLYLDSLDVNFENDEPAARHTFMEYLIARRMLARDALVCVDDNNPEGKGKGRLMAQLAALMQWECLHDGYVKVWRTNGYF